MRLFAFLLPVCLSACTASEVALDKVEAARERNDGPPLWVVEDDDSRLYLYGTVHMLPAGLDWQRPDMWDALSESGTVWLETSDAPDAQRRAERATQARGFQPAGERLSAGWDQFQTKQLEIAALQGDIPLSFLDTLEPWLAAELITVSAAEAAGLSGTIGADAAIASRARRLAKRVVALDTPAAQVASAADAPEAAQREELFALLDRYNNIGAEMQSIADEWARGDVDALEARLSASVSGADRERLYTVRNRSWAGELGAWMEGSGTGFAAVGVGHLLGEGNLRDLLERDGFRVRRFYAFQGDNVLRPVELEVDTGRADTEQAETGQAEQDQAEAGPGTGLTVSD